jgi:ABC-type antimicrobial peptide transport system permease subunit
MALIGIDYTGIESTGITYRDPIYPVLHLSQFIIYPIAVFVFTALVGLYPARYAAKISPAEAMRKGQ